MCIQNTNGEQYLRFATPTTWQIWEDYGLEWDTTLSYADHVGFRCGTCFDFPVFNIKTKQQLKLREKPLIVMEATLLHEKYQKLSNENFITKIQYLMNKCKKYKGNFVLLWHNSSLYTNKLKELYIQT